jgi:nitronate monooxygenase
MAKARATSLAFPLDQRILLHRTPMRLMSGPYLALAVSRAGGLGFIGPGAKPEGTATDFKAVRELLTVRELLRGIPAAKFSHKYESEKHLPVGVAMEIDSDDDDVAASAVNLKTPP